MREWRRLPRLFALLLSASVVCPRAGVTMMAGEPESAITLPASPAGFSSALGHKGIKDKKLMESLLLEARALGLNSIDTNNLGDIRSWCAQWADEESAVRFRILQNRVNYASIFNLEPTVENLTKTIKSKGDHGTYHFGCIAALETLDSLPDQEVKGIAMEDIQACFDRHEEWLVKTGCIRIITKIDRKTGFRKADEFMRNENVTLRAKVFLAMGLIRYDYVGGYCVMESALASTDPMTRSNVPALLVFFEGKNGEEAGNLEIDTRKLVSDALGKVTDVQSKLSEMQAKGRKQR